MLKISFILKTLKLAPKMRDTRKNKKKDPKDRGLQLTVFKTNKSLRL